MSKEKSFSSGIKRGTNIVTDLCLKNSKAIIFSIAFFVNAILVFQMYPMRTGGDEFNVLAVASFFAGQNWSSYMQSLVSYHGFGQAVFYTPLFWFLDDPVQIYRGALLINAAIVAVIPVVADQLLHGVLQLKRSSMTFIVCLLTGLWPFYYAIAKMTWNEPLTALLIWIVVYLLASVVMKKTKKLLRLGVLGFTLAYANALHGRTLAIMAGLIGASAFYLLLCRMKNRQMRIFTKKFFVATIVFVGSYGFMFVVGKGIETYLQNQLWLSRSLNNGVSSVVDKVQYLSLANMKIMIKILLGQTYYMIITSFGLVVPAFFVMIQVVFKAVREKGERFVVIQKDFLISVFIIFSTLILMGLTSFSMLSGVVRGAGRGDYLIYGRYVAPMLPVILLYGYYLKKKEFAGKWILFLSGAVYIGVCISTVIWVVPTFTAQPSMGGSSITDLMPWMTESPSPMGRGEIFSDAYFHCLDRNIRLFIIAGAFGFLLFLIFTMSKRKSLSLFLALSVVGYSHFYMGETLIKPNSNAPYHRVVGVTDFLKELHQCFGTEDVYFYQKDIRNPSEFPFLLPMYSFNMIARPLNPNDNLVDVNAIPEKSIIVSSVDLKIDCYFDSAYRIMWREDRKLLIEDAGIEKEIGTKNYYVWILGEEISQEISKIGYTIEKRDPFIPLDTGSEEWGTVLSSFLQNAESDDDCIILHPINSITGTPKVGIKFGPYYTMPSGKYRITIKGENIQNIEVDAYSEAIYVLGDEARDITDLYRYEIIEKTNETCIFDVYLIEMLSNVEFRAMNPSETDTIVINEMGYEKVG